MIRSHPLRTIAIGIVLVLLLAAGFVYAGVYNVAADEPHTRPVYALLDAARDRSIAVRATGVTVPSDLNTPARIRSGAGLYAEMCQGCHLGPGIAPTEMAQGLYPQAPHLAAGTDMTPAEEFWIIKHGVKMSGMPAWGKTHPDVLMWNMVAFLRQLPHLTPAQYAAITANAPADHDEQMQGAHPDHHD